MRKNKIQAPEIDASKMAEVMELIDRAASLMEESADPDDPAVRRELRGLQRRLRELTGNPKLRVGGFREYWAYSSLESAAQRALRLPPQKGDATDEQIRRIVVTVFSADYMRSYEDTHPGCSLDAEMDYWIRFLEVTTGLDNLSDYIFYPDLLGMRRDVSLEQIADRILADKNRLS